MNPTAGILANDSTQAHNVPTRKVWTRPYRRRREQYRSPNYGKGLGNVIKNRASLRLRRRFHQSAYYKLSHLGNVVRREEIDNQLKEAAFEYFYWFSRFEFALKENKYLKSHNPGAKAEPNWEEFQNKHSLKYAVSQEAIRLKELHPKRQTVSTHGELKWVPVGVAHCANDLSRTITMLKTIRNNLFHGGKHGDSEMDNKKRNLELLNIGKLVLDQLAKVGGIESDYTRYY